MTIHQTFMRKAASPFEQRFLDLYSDVAGKLPGAGIAEVRLRREAALDAFIATGLPHRRVEEWKYTDLRALMPEVYPLNGVQDAAGGDIGIEAAIGKSFASLDAYRAVFVDGALRPDLSSLGEAEGFTFKSFRNSAGEVPPTASAYTEVPMPSGDTIAALGEAFATDGATLVVEPGAKPSKPLHLIFITASASPRLTAYRNAVTAGEGSELSLIETYATTGPGQLFSQTRLAIEAGASVRHIRVNLGAGGKHLSSTAAELGSKARYDPVQLTVGGALTRAQSFIRFAGEGGRCHYAGAMMLRDRAHADFTLVVEHAAPNCESRELAKAVLDGRARGVFQGKVIVQRGAQKTDGKQMANALLLSDEAEFDSKPELEIYADDVVCGHGATAGQLDQELMFYLRARGIPETQARALLISAFAGEAFAEIEDEALRLALQEKVDGWLQG